MEKLAAVFRAKDTKTGQIKYGSTWIKRPEDAILRSRGAITIGETLEAVWWVDWRDAANPYNLSILGVRPRDDKPEIDVAASLRSFNLKPKGPKGGKRGDKPRWKRRGDKWVSINTDAIHPNVVQLVQKQIGKPVKRAETAKIYTPPYKIWFAEEQNFHAEEK